MDAIHGLLTIREAAAALRLEPFTVQLWIWRRKLKAVKRQRRWFIPAREVRRALKQREEVREKCPKPNDR